MGVSNTQTDLFQPSDAAALAMQLQMKHRSHHNLGTVADMFQKPVAIGAGPASVQHLIFHNAILYIARGPYHVQKHAAYKHQ